MHSENANPSREPTWPVDDHDEKRVCQASRAMRAIAHDIIGRSDPISSRERRVKSVTVVRSLKTDGNWGGLSIFGNDLKDIVSTLCYANSKRWSQFKSARPAE